MLLDEWIADGETRGRSPNTLHGYRSKAARIKAGPLDGVELAKLTTVTWTAGTTLCWPTG